MSIRAVLVAFVVIACVGRPVLAADRYALVVSGVSGGDEFAEKYAKWRGTLTGTLKEAFLLPDDHVIVLSEDASDPAGIASRENVRQALERLRARVQKDDVLLVILIGHGTFDGADAKFNLTGPDLTASDWRDLLNSIAGRVVVVNTTGASAPFLERLAGRNRIVITATDTAAQRYETMFAEFFIAALRDPACDQDKNARLSIWETFVCASASVRRSYEQQGRLATERPVLDDDGDGRGRDSEGPGDDGALARATYLDPGSATPAALASAGVAALERRQATLVAEIEALKSRKGVLPPEGYAAELEKLLIELARVSRQIRTGS